MRAPTRSRIATSDYKPYAGIEPGAEVAIWEEITSSCGGGGRRDRAALQALFVRAVTEASVLLFGQFQELRLMSCSLLEREEDTLQQSLHRSASTTNCSSVLVRNAIQSLETWMPILLSVPPARATGAGPCGEFQSGSRPRDTLIARRVLYGNEHNGDAGLGSG